MKFWILVVVMAATCTRIPKRAIVGGAPVADEARAVDDETVRGRADFADGWPARTQDGVNALVEIPAGTVAKFEVADGALRWAHRREDGARRAIDFLPYPVNYGSVPCTLAEDGDAIDVLVLGRAMERGHVAEVRVIGMLEMLDDGVIHDDKLIGVPLEPAWENGFSQLHDLDDLDTHYPGARGLIEEWFRLYWGPGATDVVGWGDAAEAARALDDTISCTVRA